MAKTLDPPLGEDSTPNDLSKTKKGDEEKSKRRFKLKVKINQATLPLKITLFLYYGAMSAILPYLTIHMQAIGISITEVAVIYAVLPFTSVFGPPIFGALADMLGNYKWILILGTVGNGLFHTLLLFVPQFQAPSIANYEIVVKWDTNLGQGLFVPIDIKHCPLLTKPDILDPVKSLHLTGCHSYAESQQSSLLADWTVYEQVNCIMKIGGHVTVTVTDAVNAELLLCQSAPELSNPGYGNNQITFWVYFLFRVIATACMGSCFTLLDATTLAVVKRCGKAEYGKERIFSIVGAALVSPIAGVLVDRISIYKESTDYSPAFYLSNALLGCSIIAFILIELEVEKPEKGVLKNAAKLFHYPEVVVFLVMIFLLGNMWGFVESFLFIFLKELEAPNYLLGLTLTVGSLMGLPFLWGSEKIVAKFGRVNLIIAAFITYFLRFFGYSYLQNPFWCFPFEAMEAFTYHLMWVSAATYCSLLAPKGMLASLMGIMGALHYSLGKGAGSFFGGLVYGLVGARHAFRYFGIAAGAFGILFYMLDYFWIRKVIAKRVDVSKEVEIGPEFQNLGGKRGSIFDANELAGMSSVLNLNEDEDVGEERISLDENQPDAK